MEDKMFAQFVHQMIFLNLTTIWHSLHYQITHLPRESLQITTTTFSHTCIHQVQHFCSHSQCLHLPGKLQPVMATEFLNLGTQRMAKQHSCKKELTLFKILQLWKLAKNAINKHCSVSQRLSEKSNEATLSMLYEKIYFMFVNLFG